MLEKATINSPIRHDVSLLSDHDVYLFKQGNHFRLYNKLGSHLYNHHGEAGVIFAVWAPNAKSVSVIGDFNDWDPRDYPMRCLDRIAENRSACLLGHLAHPLWDSAAWR